MNKLDFILSKAKRKKKKIYVIIKDFKPGDFAYIIPGGSQHVEIFGKILRIEGVGKYLETYDTIRGYGYGLSRDMVLKVCCETCLFYKHEISKCSRGDCTQYLEWADGVSYKNE